LPAYLKNFERLADRIQAALSAPRLTLPVLLLLAASAVFPSSPADPDLFARVALGRLAQTSGSVPTVDPFSFSPKLPVWIDHEWLSGVVFWNVVSRWGDVGLITLKVALVSVTAALTVAATRASSAGSHPSLLFLVLCLGQGIYSWASTIRCQTFTYLFLAYQFFALVTHRQKGAYRYLVPLPLIAVVWVNIHGGYALGITFLWLWTLLYFVERTWSWPLFLASALSSAAPFFTPYGAVTFSKYLFHAITMNRPTISEWAPLWHHPLLFGALLVVMVPIAVGVVLTRDIRRHMLPIGILAYATYCGMSHLRFVTATVMAYAIVGGVYVDASLREAHRWFPLRMARLGRVVATAGLALIGLSLVIVVRAAARPSTYRLDYSAYPVSATQWLRDNQIKGRLLVDFNNGSFALWRLYPKMTISMDGRYEAVYPAETERLNADALAFGTPESARAITILNPTHALVRLTTPYQVLSPHILASWNQIYRDERYAILSRQISPADYARDDPPGSNDMWAPLF
jgi:hypothetical protein